MACLQYSQDGYSETYIILTSEGNIVEMRRRLYRLDLSTDIVLFNSIAEVSYGGMRWVISTENLDGLFRLIWPIHILNCKTIRRAGEHHTRWRPTGENCKCFIIARISKSDTGAGDNRELGNVLLRDIKSNWHRK